MTQKGYLGQVIGVDKWSEWRINFIRRITQRNVFFRCKIISAQWQKVEPRKRRQKDFFSSSLLLYCTTDPKRRRCLPCPKKTHKIRARTRSSWVSDDFKLNSLKVISASVRSFRYWKNPKPSRRRRKKKCFALQQHTISLIYGEYCFRVQSPDSAFSASRLDAMCASFFFAHQRTWGPRTTDLLFVILICFSGSRNDF